MAKIDVSGISGFDDMTPEEKVQALLGFEYDDGSEKNAKTKAAFDKAASELASLKKQLNAKLSDEERAKQENESKLKELTEKLAEYEMRDKISTAKTLLLGQGLDEKSADIAANAFVNGDIKGFIPAMSKYRESIEVQTKSSLMGSNPKPDSANHAESAGSESTEASGDAANAAKIFAELHAAQYGEAAPQT